MKSTVTEKDLLRMVDDKVLPENSLIRWSATDGELFPTANTGELVVFEPFFYRGFSLPTNKFFRGLLHFYGIELVHLNPPNFRLHPSLRSFLGRRAPFCPVSPPVHPPTYSKRGETCVVGGAALQLQYGRADKYLDLDLKTSLKGWHSRWFYTANPNPPLPAYIGRRPEQRVS